MRCIYLNVLLEMMCVVVFVEFHSFRGTCFTVSVLRLDTHGFILFHYLVKDIPVYSAGLGRA
jgi:hypothetical protein